MHKLPVPHYQQIDDGYCLPACVQMVLAYWGQSYSQKKIAKQLKTIPKAGTPGSRLRLFASKRLSVVYESGSIENLKLALEQGIPPIMLVYTGELPYWSIAAAHAVVVTGISDTTFILNDPAWPTPAVHVPYDDMLLAWDVMYNYYAILKSK